MTERLLNDSIVEQLRETFLQLREPVQVLYFGQKAGCDYCEDTQRLIEEVAALSDKLGLSVHDLEVDAETAHQYGVNKAPGLVIAGRDGEQILDYGVRYAGIPAGHEFSALIHDLVLVSSRDSGLDQKTRDFLGKLTQPVSLQVFVTPT